MSPRLVRSAWSAAASSVRRLRGPAARRASAVLALLFASVAVLCAPSSAEVASDSSAARSEDRDFVEGVAAYRAGDYDAARRAFEAALQSPGADRAACLRNMGNVAYRQRRPLESVAWFTAALREAPRDVEGWRNLEYARREAGLPPADRGDLRDTAARLATMLRLDEAERLVLALLAALGVVLVWEALRGGVAAKATAWALVALTLLALVPYTTQLARRNEDPCFVIQPEGAALLSEPRDSAVLVDRLAPASVVERVDRLPGWVRVRREGAAAAWVREDSVLALNGR